MIRWHNGQTPINQWQPQPHPLQNSEPAHTLVPDLPRRRLLTQSLQWMMVGAAAALPIGCSRFSDEGSSQLDDQATSLLGQRSNLRLTPIIDASFDATQTELIRGAFDVLNQRMFNGQVAQNLNSLRDQWEVVVQDAAWQKSLSLPAEEQIAPVRDQLLMHQLDGLSAIEVPVQIDHFNQDSDRWGEAYVGVVTCRRSAGGNVVLDGTFRLSLNAHFMGNRELWQGTDPKVWAVVIAHELLHNLGHMHNDRAALTQMIAFERCLYYDGNYTLDLVCPEYECGAKTLPPAT